MTGDKKKISILVRNYGSMTDEGKNKLLSLGERYLREKKRLGTKYQTQRMMKESSMTEK